MTGREHTITSVWPADSPQAALALQPRDDLLTEQAEHAATTGGPASFSQAIGPFRSYHRTIDTTEHQVTETITYRLVIPWFGALFTLPVRRILVHRPPREQPAPGGHHPTG